MKYISYIALLAVSAFSYKKTSTDHLSREIPFLKSMKRRGIGMRVAYQTYSWGEWWKQRLPQIGINMNPFEDAASFDASLEESGFIQYLRESFEEKLQMDDKSERFDKEVFWVSFFWSFCYDFDLDETDEYGKTCLHYAVFFPDTLGYILNNVSHRDKKLDILDDQGITPIMQAAALAQKKSCEKLLDNSNYCTINLYHQDKYGKDIFNHLLDAEYKRSSAMPGSWDESGRSSGEYLKTFELLIDPKRFKHDQRAGGHLLLDCVSKDLVDETKLLLNTVLISQEVYDKTSETILKRIDRFGKTHRRMNVLKALEEYYKNNIVTQKEQITNLYSIMLITFCRFLLLLLNN